MKKDFLLNSNNAKDIYNKIKDYPIYDYHCHLSAKEIWEDKPFDNIGQMWLESDHYKWRLMRAFGIAEEFITGSASWYDKFLAYVKSVQTAGGNPLYSWSHMELDLYFNENNVLCEENADIIWQSANRYIKEKNLSPRKIIEKSNVKFIGTTDDIIDNLEYHKKLKQDKSFEVEISPSFRTDNVLLLNKADYKEYIDILSDVSKVDIVDIKSLQKAIVNRLDVFKQVGCKFSDVGIQYFPNREDSFLIAENAFKKALERKPISEEETSAFIWHMYLFLAKEYKKRDIIMQLHLAVKRNVNTKLFTSIGVDCGGDCIGDIIDGSKIIKLLDAMNENDGLPKTIVYTLNPVMNEQLCAIAGSFNNVRVGTAWWFNDNKSGIENTIQTIAQIGHIGTFLGMLTDSRSFLSYARHDYFRRILCNIIAKWQESGEYLGDASSLAKAICFENIKNFMKCEL